jgi:hypothetical protein
MSKEFQEPEEKDLNDTSNAEILDDFSPLDEPILEKEYTKHNVRINPNEFRNDIPEPSFMPPPMTGMINEEEKIKKPQEPFNKELKDLPKKDKEMASEKVAEMCITTYKWLNDFADSKLLIDERKLNKMQQNGEIDLSVEIPMGSTSLTAIEFVQEYNEQSKGTISVSKEFEEEVRPVLTRVLEKRGIGMTDENYLAYLVVKDLVVKGFMAKQSLNVKKDILSTLKEATMLIRGNAQPQPQAYQPQPQPQQQQYAPQPPIPTYEVEEEEEEIYEEPSNPDTNVNDFVNEMVGSKPKSKIKSISEARTKSTGKRGRPKKK